MMAAPPGVPRLPAAPPAGAPALRPQQRPQLARHVRAPRPLTPGPRHVPRLCAPAPGRPRGFVL